MNGFDKTMRFIVQNFFKAFTVLVSYVLYDVKYINKHNIPKKGGCVIAANHSSFFDPPFVGSVTFRRIFRFMAKDTIFKSPIFGALMRWMGAFPVKRANMDRKAWRTFVKIVESGECVMLFPEGTRTPDGQIHQGKAGVGMLIHMAKTPVVPVYVHGLFEIWPKGQKLPKFFKKAVAIFGKPMDFSEYFGSKGCRGIYLQITDKIMARIKELKKELLAQLTILRNSSTGRPTL